MKAPATKETKSTVVAPAKPLVDEFDRNERTPSPLASVSASSVSTSLDGAATGSATGAYG
jgi:hypothetical protein